MTTQTPRMAAALELLDAMPKLATRTAARTLHANRPRLFPTVEAARDTVRLIRGAKGAKQCAQRHQRPRAKQAAGAGTYPALPDAKQEVASFEPLRIAGPCVVGVLSDVHVPFHDVAALSLALADVEARNPDVLLLNGDIVDFYEVSKHEKNPELLDFPGALEAARQLFAHLRGRFPTTRIVYKLGNHEERWQRWLAVQAPVVYGCTDFHLRQLLRLDEHKIELVQDARRIMLGKLNVLHGHEYRFAISNPVNPARGLFLRGKVNALCGHFHQVSQHSEKTLEGKLVSTFSAGCLCQISPQYHPYNNWSHGHAIVTVDKDGGWHVENRRIVAGQIW